MERLPAYIACPRLHHTRSPRHSVARLFSLIWSIGSRMAFTLSYPRILEKVDNIFSRHSYILALDDGEGTKLCSTKSTKDALLIILKTQLEGDINRGKKCHF